MGPGGTASTPAPLKEGPVYSFDRPGTARETFIRGSLFAPVPPFMRAYLGPTGWEEFLQRVDPVASTALRSEFVALAWYPFRVITSTIEVLATTGKMIGKPDAVRDLAFHN